MKITAAVLFVNAMAQSEDDQMDAASNALCEAVGRGSVDIPASGEMALCDGVVRASQQDDGAWVCQNDYHLGHSLEVSCDKNEQLLVVRHTVQLLVAQAGSDKSLEPLLHDYCNSAAGDCTRAIQPADLNGAWTCLNTNDYSRCDSGPGLSTVMWAFGHFTSPTAMPTGAAIPFPIPRCTPPEVRLFNRGVCNDDCPMYEESQNIDGENVCLPALTYQSRRLVNSTLEATMTGEGSISLRIDYPLLPVVFAEDVDINYESYVVDMKERVSELNRLTANPCDAKWERHFVEPLPTLTEQYGEKIQGMFANTTGTRYGVEDMLVKDLTNFPANTSVRVSCTLIFAGDEGSSYDNDAITLSVNDIAREPYWQRIGRTHDEVLIHRQHVCQRGTASAGAEKHCKDTFVFDAETDADGELRVVIRGLRSDENLATFSWAVANFKVEMPFLTTTLFYGDLDDDCQLGDATSVGEGSEQYLELCGYVSLALVGNWTDAEGPRRQRMNSVIWPVCLHFSSWVMGDYEPFEVWNSTIFEEKHLEGGNFMGYLELFEPTARDTDFLGVSNYTTRRQVPRYELGAIAHAGHCLSTEGTGLNMRFQSLWLSENSDPLQATNGVDMTASVTVSHSEDGCVFFSFVPQELCPWCTLHSFSVVEARRLDNMQAEVVAGNSGQDTGIAVNSIVGFGTLEPPPTPAPPTQFMAPAPPTPTPALPANAAPAPPPVDHISAASAASVWAAAFCMAGSLAIVV